MSTKDDTEKSALPNQEEVKSYECLSSIAIDIETKRFYVTLYKNEQGKYFQIKQVTSTKTKPRINISETAAQKFCNCLLLFQACKNEHSLNSERTEVDLTIKKDVIVDGQRKLFLDLKENKDGIFFKIRQISIQGRPRDKIIMHASGLKELRHTITGILDSKSAASIPPTVGDNESTEINELTEPVGKEEIKLTTPTNADDPSSAATPELDDPDMKNNDQHQDMKNSSFDILSLPKPERLLCKGKYFYFETTMFEDKIALHIHEVGTPSSNIVVLQDDLIRFRNSIDDYIDVIIAAAGRKK